MTIAERFESGELQEKADEAWSEEDEAKFQAGSFRDWQLVYENEDN